MTAGDRATASAPARDALSRAAGRVRSRRIAGEPSLILAGAGWTPRIVAVEARILDELRTEAERDRFFEHLDEVITARRAKGAAGGTGIALLLDYDVLNASGPRAFALAVDRSVSLDALEEADDDEAAVEPHQPSRAIARPRTSLRRADYLRAVATVREHIACGDVYQANLCQQISVECAGDVFETWVEAYRSAAPPLAAWIEARGVSVASLSPETFLLSREPGVVETHPIKGTRARHADPERDRAAARELLASAKDRAELTMIVDLERNDLGRVSMPGTIEVVEPASLQSFATLHHLIGRVRGRLRPGVRPSELVRATYPGGSITGAPKRRAIEILAGLEPVRRGFYTGSLLWFDDDGTLCSNLLIRTLVAEGGRVMLGAGGGVVADSDPEAEWRESNDKARALARALGFEPEEAC